MPYTIKGVGRTGPLTATRLLPASAGVLGMKWVEMGAIAVTVTDNEGAERDLLSFRERITRQFMAGKRSAIRPQSVV